MDVVRLGRVIRTLRVRKGWRQADLAARARVGRTTISNVELGRIRGLSVGAVEAILGALGLSLDLSVRGLGGTIDRVLDERHARLVALATSWLRRRAWSTAAEVSYSVWGERGSIDLIAWHPATHELVVIEVKSELTSLEATLRKHDEKVRLAPSVVESRFGWRPTNVSRLLVLPEDRTQRRRVVDHRVVLDAAYPARNRAVHIWVRAQRGADLLPPALSGIVFLSDSALSGGRAGRTPRERVRVRSGTRIRA